MSKRSRLLKNISGSALVTAVVFAAIFSILGSSTIMIITNGSNLYKRDVDVISTYWANEAAINLTRRWISIQNNLPTLATRATVSIQEGGSDIITNGFTPTATCVGAPPTYTITSNTNISGSIANNSVNVISTSNIQKYTFFGKGTNANAWRGAVINGNYHTNGHLFVDANMDEQAHVTGVTSVSELVSRPNYANPYDIGTIIEGWDDEPENGR